MTRTARGTFQISMKPAESSSAQLGRMTFEKTWAGDLNGQSQGEMLSVGDPQSGTAAYTVLEWRCSRARWTDAGAGSRFTSTARWSVVKRRCFTRSSPLPAAANWRASQASSG